MIISQKAKPALYDLRGAGFGFIFALLFYYNLEASFLLISSFGIFTIP